jgi:hypothetical protein
MLLMHVIDRVVRGSGRDLLATISSSYSNSNSSNSSTRSSTQDVKGHATATDDTDCQHRVGSFRFNDFDIIEIGSTVKLSVTCWLCRHHW